MLGNLGLIYPRGNELRKVEGKFLIEEEMSI
jgi:hypothetical protein